MNRIEKYKPLGDKIIVEVPIEEVEQKLASGIIIPKTAESKDKLQRGVVVAVGTGRYQDGKRVPSDVKKGQTVLFSKFNYDEIIEDSKKYVILSELNIFSICPPK